MLSIPVRASFRFVVPGVLPTCRLDHIILTLRSTNGLWLENIPRENIILELQESMLQQWPSGHNSADSRRGKWKIEFAGSPWAAVGQDALWYALTLSCLPGIFVVADSQGALGPGR